MGTETTSIPSPSPPGTVRFIVLEFTRQEDRDKNLVHRTLDRDDGNETKNRMRGVPTLQEPLA